MIRLGSKERESGKTLPCDAHHHHPPAKVRQGAPGQPYARRFICLLAGQQANHASQLSAAVVVFGEK